MNMHLRRKLAGAVTLLVVLGIVALVAFNIFRPTASKPPTASKSATLRQSAKDTTQLLPKTLISRSGTPIGTSSIYESTTTAASLLKQGCQAAHQAPGLIILDWGQPVSLGNNTYGTYDFGGNVDSDTAILHAVANFAQGVWNCRIASTNIALGIGENNYYSNHAPLLTPAAWYADGQQWGRMVNSVQSFLSNNHYTNVVGANGAGDLKVEWATFPLTSSMVNGYNSVTRRIYFDFGDNSPGWWTNEQVWYVAYGAPDNLPLPEVFNQADANNWEALDVWACRSAGGPMYFKGIMSEFVSNTNSPGQAFADMYNAEASNSCTARDLSGMIFTTQIYHTASISVTTIGTQVVALAKAMADALYVKPACGGHISYPNCYYTWYKAPGSAYPHGAPVFPQAVIQYGQQVCAGCSTWANGNYQCVSFVRGAYSQAYSMNLTANAFDLWATYAGQPGWQEIPSIAAPASQRSTPMPGDVMVFKNAGIGHVAIVMSVVQPTATANGSITFSNANSTSPYTTMPLLPDLSVASNWNGYSVWGYLRPAGGTQTSPTT